MAKLKSRYTVAKRKMRYPASIERDYARLLRSIARALHEATMSRIDTIKAMSARRMDETDSEFVLRLITEAYAAMYVTEKAIAAAMRIARQVMGYNQSEFYAVLRSALRVDIFAAEPQLTALVDEWVAYNTSLIKSIPADYHSKLQGIISRGLQQGTLASDMGKEIQELYGVTSRRAQLIARDQIGSLNGMLTQKRQTAAGIGVYQWSSSRDSRVRPEHADREGGYYAWAGSGMTGKVINGKKVRELPVGGKPPGMEIHCRCVALPVIDTEALQGGIRL